MPWILIAVVSGSILTSGHETKEACMGRVSTLSEQKITAQCVEIARPGLTFNTCTNCMLVR